MGCEGTYLSLLKREEVRYSIMLVSDVLLHLFIFLRYLLDTNPVVFLVYVSLNRLLKL